MARQLFAMASLLESPTPGTSTGAWGINTAQTTPASRDWLAGGAAGFAAGCRNEMLGCSFIALTA